MTHGRTGALLAAFALSLAMLTVPSEAQRATAPPPAQPDPPRLLVLLVIDQFRADYLDWYGSQWTGGLHRLRTTGALYPRAAQPYAITKTCAGHASIGTGRFPSAHGLVDNDWYDVERRGFVTCTADPGVTAISLSGQAATERHSAASLRVPTLGDELRRQATTPPRIVSIALKARAAISLGGHGGPGTIILWEEDSGAWATSTAFASSAWPEVEGYLRAHPTSAARGAIWNRLLPAATYRNDDRGIGEPSAAAFPHPVVAPPGVNFTAVWDMSPWSDAYLADLGSALVERAGLGRRATTDLLAVGFSALDYVGHSYGPRSHEVQDVLARLDLVLGRLFESLDRSVGADKYVVALTSDHGVAELPDQAAAFTGTAGGRVSLNALGQAIETALSVSFGRRAFIEAITGTYVHFLPGVLDRLRADPAAQQLVVTAAEGVRGIERVFWSWDLSSRAPTNDARLTAMRRSYVAGRSGDLGFQPDPNWVLATAGTNHGSWHAYDTDVPLMLMGAGIKAGLYNRPATPLDVAPTLAALAGIVMPQSDGRILSEAIGR